MTKVHIEIIEALGEEFDRAAGLSGASALEVLVAAVTYASLAADFVTDQKNARGDTERARAYAR
jgi:hypothetical protein